MKPVHPDARFLMVWPCSCAGEGCDECGQVGRQEAAVSREQLLAWIVGRLGADGRLMPCAPAVVQPPVVVLDLPPCPDCSHPMRPRLSGGHFCARCRGMKGVVKANEHLAKRRELTAKAEMPADVPVPAPVTPAQPPSPAPATVVAPPPIPTGGMPFDSIKDRKLRALVTGAIESPTFAKDGLFCVIRTHGGPHLKRRHAVSPMDELLGTAHQSADGTWLWESCDDLEVTA